MSLPGTKESAFRKKAAAAFLINICSAFFETEKIVTLCTAPNLTFAVVLLISQMFCEFPGFCVMSPNFDRILLFFLKTHELQSSAGIEEKPPSDRGGQCVVQKSCRNCPEIKERNIFQILLTLSEKR